MLEEVVNLVVGEDDAVNVPVVVGAVVVLEMVVQALQVHFGKGETGREVLFEIGEGAPGIGIRDLGVERVQGRVWQTVHVIGVEIDPGILGDEGAVVVNALVNLRLFCRTIPGRTENDRGVTRQDEEFRVHVGGNGRVGGGKVCQIDEGAVKRTGCLNHIYAQWELVGGSLFNAHLI